VIEDISKTRPARPAPLASMKHPSQDVDGAVSDNSEERDSLTSAFSMLAARVALLEHRLERLRWQGPVLALVSAGLLIYALWHSLS